MKLPYIITAAFLYIGCGEKQDTAQTCTEITEDFTMTSDEYNAFLSESEELTEESCSAICEATESEYDTIVDCELTGQTTGAPEAPPTATVTCTYNEEPC